MTSRLPIFAGAMSGLAVAALAGTSAALYPDLNVRDKWSWYEDDANFPMTCLDGSYTGYGYYIPSNWNGNVMFFLDGGGACYDSQSCSNPVISPLTIAADVLLNTKPGPSQVPFVFRQKYNQTDFQNDQTPSLAPDPNGVSWSTATLNRGVFDHVSATNPFRNYMMVFVPYCTGDMHIGYRQLDNSSSIGRTPSQKSFMGLLDSYYSMITTLQALQNAGRIPAKIVLSGGSAGGFGADYLYGWLRYVIGFMSGWHPQVITISDSGTPYFSGSSSNGQTWTQQGYMGRAGTSPSQVNSMEEYFYDAWGTTWTAVYPANLVSQPLGNGHSFLPAEYLEAYNIGQALQNPSSSGYGDKFAIIDGTSDWMYWLFTPLFMTDDPQGRRPNILDAANQLATVVSLHMYFPVQNRATTSGPLPWYKHHGFMTDDVSTWTSSGSNLSQILSNLPL